METLKRKHRKPRTKSRNMCVPCGNVMCDPMLSNSGAARKIRKRAQAGLCPGCGEKPDECHCKRKGLPQPSKKPKKKLWYYKH